VADAAVLAEVRSQGLDPQAYLAINDAYTFFEAVGGLLKTGPTHTNVMDLRVAIVA
jgi:hydroxypyruvate reductase